MTQLQSIPKQMELSRTINQFVIQTVLSSSGYASNIALARLGIDLETIQRIRNLPAGALDTITNAQFPLGCLTIDLTMLNNLLQLSEKEYAFEQLMNRAIALEASYTMLFSLTAISQLDFRHRRQLMGLPISQGGRPKTIRTEKEVIAFLTAWRRHSEISDVLHRFCLVGEDTGLRLNQMWAYVMTLQGSSPDNSTRWQTKLQRKSEECLKVG